VWLLSCPFIVVVVFQAEARLAAKRAARAEARDIRMRELERQQKEVKHDLDLHRQTPLEMCSLFIVMCL